MSLQTGNAGSKKTKLLFLYSALVFWGLSLPLDAANFIHNGINRRAPHTDVEKATAAATGNIFCRKPDGPVRFSSGFVVKNTRNMQQNLVMSSGHAFTDMQTFQFHPECYYKPFLATSSRPLNERKTGPLAQASSLDAIRNDWGTSVFQNINTSSYLTMTTRTFAEVIHSIETGAAVVKHYSTLYEGVPDTATVLVSDQCTIMQPGEGALLGDRNVLYTDCDEVQGSSGGALVLEFADGTVEAVGIMFGSVQEDRTVRAILARHPEAKKIEDVDFIDIEPSTSTMINVAIPLIPEMQPLSLSEALFRH